MALDVDPRATAAGFLGGVVVLGILLWFVGVQRVIDALARADPLVLAAVAGVALAWLLCWGLALRTVLGILGIDLTVGQSFLVFSAATFANNVTPFGQAGGEPFSALLIARVADSDYEIGLAAIASVDALNFLPSLGLALVGVTYFAATLTVGDRLGLAAVSVVGMILVVAVVAVLGWRYRYRVEGVAVTLFAPVIRALARLIPGRSPPERSAIARRIEGFFHTIERIAGHRRGLVVALGFATLGWLGLAASLWLSLFALGYTVPVAAPLLAVPLGAMASVTPLPGGLGGIEAVLIGLLAPTTGLPVEVVGAAVLVHRGATYWLPVLVGGGAASALGTDAVAA